MQLTTVTATGTKGTMTASDLVFAAKVNQFLLAQAIRVYLNNDHTGTSIAQTRSEVTRTKKKWFKQKGTGNARHGSRSSNIFVGGGAAHGPSKFKPTVLTLSKKQKQKALISALSLRAETILVCDAIAKLAGKTKDADKLIKKISPETKKLTIVLDKIDEKVFKSLRNLPELKILEARRVNAFDVVNTQKIIASKAAIETLELRLVGPLASSVTAKEAKLTKTKTKTAKK